MDVLGLFGRAVALAGTLAMMAVLATPRLVFEAAELELPVPEGVARGVAFVLMVVCFALFSGPSKFGADEVVRQPTAPVDHLLPMVPPETANQFPDLAALSTAVGLVAEGRKIEAIKAIRVSPEIDLKDAKELVEEIQRAVQPSLAPQ
ncbi:MAG: hypothetical protein GY953_46385 [bacterium]|nr:hypothetical protein [bacterium]